jgi:hypothetical protein
VDGAEMRQYWPYCCKGVSLPHFQDFPAVLSLLADGDLQQPIFFPGHSADMVAGSHIPPCHDRLDKPPDGPTVTEYLLGAHYWLWPLGNLPRKSPLPAALRQKIAGLSEAPWSEGNWHPAARCDMWNLEARQALFIINSVRGYEYASARWRTLWDSGLMDFFLKVPIEQRVGKRLYINTLRRRIFTGPAARLAEIPIVSVGRGIIPWSDDLADRCKKPETGKGLRPKLKNVGRAVLSSVGLYNFALDLLNPRIRVDGPCHAETWFAGGRDPMQVTIAQALKPYGTLDKLPRSLLPLVEPWLGRRVDLFYFNAILAAVVLGELCAGAYLEQ